MQIRPIKTKTDHRAALKEIERRMDAKPGTPAGDRLEILTTLVDHYESQREPIEPPDPIDALLYHMESRGLTRRDLEPFLGSRARIAEVLNRCRPLTIDGIRGPDGLQLAMYGFGNENSTEQLGKQLREFEENEIVDRRRVRNDSHRPPR